MSDDNNFDPRNFPELFGDDELNPLEMALLMQLMNQNTPQNASQPVNLFSGAGQQSSPFANLFGVPPLFNLEEAMLDPEFQQIFGDIPNLEGLDDEFNSIPELNDLFRNIESNQQFESTPIIQETITEEVIDLTGEEPIVKEVKEIINPHVKHKKSNRCNMIECKSKLGLLGFDCKCGYKFCSKHRHTDTHYCKYDYVTEDRKKLESNNPQVINDKIHNRL